MKGLPDVLALGVQVSASRCYNGFTWPERMTSNPPQRIERYKRGNNPTVCSITGFSDPLFPRDRGYIFSHNEDYRRPLWWHPVSRLTHQTLHARFKNPRKWFDLVARHYVHGAWFTLLSMNPARQFPLPNQPGGRFDLIYPQGLPDFDKPDPALGDFLGLSRELFLSTDLREPIRALWKWPLSPAPAAVDPPIRRRA
jgi:hypothetical protein